MLNARFQARRDVAFRTLGDECLLVPVRTSPDQKLAVFALNPVGACVWSCLQSPHTQAEIVAAVVREFEVSQEIAARDVETFLAELRSRDLLLEGSGADLR
jgi:hypothetical protein